MERVQSEQDWTENQHPTALLDFVRQSKFSFRKMRLLMCAFARQMPDDRANADDWQALLASERYADSAIAHDELHQLRMLHAVRRRHGNRWSYPLLGPNKLLRDSCLQVLRSTVEARIDTTANRPDWQEIKELRHALLGGERPPFAALIREVFGNPFRPVTLDSRWQTETAVALAAGIYAERAFDRMPILADALEDAGCDHAGVLTHCRDDGPHVRGCWVVDLVLGKE